MSSWSRTKTPYLVTLVGVLLGAAAEIYSMVRAMMFRAMFRPGGFNGTGFNGTGGGPYSGYGGPRPFGGGMGFGLSGYVVIFGLILAIIGVVWLGLELRRSPKST